MKHLFLFLMLCLSVVACKKDKDCPPQFKGSDCDIEITPTRVRITAIQLTNYPATNNGQQWDTNSQWADPYFKILDTGGVIFESNYLDEKQPASISQWSTNIVLDPEKSYAILFYDEDGSIDASIDDAALVPYIEGRGFPERHDLSASNGSNISVWVEYEY